MIAMEDLIRTIYEIVSVIEIVFFLQMVLDLADVYLWRKWVRVHDCYHNFFPIYTLWLKICLLEVLCAPRNVASFSFLLILSDMVYCVSHMEKFASKSFDQFFGFYFWSFFMSLHR